MATHRKTVSNDEILRILKKSPRSRRASVSTADLRSVVREGLSFSAFEAVRMEIDLPQNQLSAILGIKSRTITRRKEVQQLSVEESDRLFRFARIIALATRVLGDKTKARTWLKRPNRGLGTEAPLNLLDTDIGAHQVEDMLTRIEYGIYS